MSLPSLAMAESGSILRRTRWIGFGFSPGWVCGSAAKTAPAKRPAPRDHTIVRCCIWFSSLGFAVHRTGGGVEDQLPARRLIEIEHVHDRTGRGVERATAEPLTSQPVVLDELGNRGLRDERVADVVLLCERRDHHERLAHAGTATPRNRLAQETVR